MKKQNQRILAAILSIALPTALLAHSDAFKPEFVVTLVEPYLAIQKAMAGDDFPAAKAGAKHYLEAMKQAPHEGEARAEAADLSAPAKAIAESSDLKAARAAFLDLSRDMGSLVQHVGTSGDTPLYVAHCPMAFDKKGGMWMQSDKTIANPYFGSMMRGCGKIQKQIAGKTDEDPESKEHDKGMGHMEHDAAGGDHKNKTDHSAITRWSR